MVFFFVTDAAGVSGNECIDSIMKTLQLVYRCHARIACVVSCSVLRMHKMKKEDFDQSSETLMKIKANFSTSMLFMEDIGLHFLGHTSAFWSRNDARGDMRLIYLLPISGAGKRNTDTVVQDGDCDERRAPEAALRKKSRRNEKDDDGDGEQGGDRIQKGEGQLCRRGYGTSLSYPCVLFREDSYFFR